MCTHVTAVTRYERESMKVWYSTIVPVGLSSPDAAFGVHYPESVCDSACVCVCVYCKNPQNELLRQQPSQQLDCQNQQQLATYKTSTAMFKSTSSYSQMYCTKQELF